MSRSDSLAVVALRGPTGAVSVAAAFATVWLAGRLYKRRAQTEVLVLMENTSLGTEPNVDEITRLTGLACSLSSAWPNAAFGSLGEELASDMVDPRARDAGISADRRAQDLADFRWRQEEHRLTASTLKIGVRGHEPCHAGVSVRLHNALFVDEPRLAEQILLHEVLRVVDYYAPLHGERLSV